MLWSTAFAAIKVGLAYSPPLCFAGLRFLLAGLILFPLTGNPVSSLKIVRRNLSFVVQIAFFYTVLLYTCFYLGLSLGSASTAAIVTGGGPLFIAVMAHFAMPDEKLTPKRVISLVLGMSGILIIAASRYSLDWNTGKPFFAVLLLVAANLFSGWGNIMIAKSRRDISPLLLSSSQLIIGGAVLLVISFVVERPDLSAKPLPFIGALLYLSALSAAAITIWFGLLRRPGVKVSELNIWKFLVPVLGALLSWTILDDDRPEAAAVIGMGAVAASLVLINLNRKHGGINHPALD